MAIYFKACPKCRGDMTLIEDHVGSYKDCLMCGTIVNVYVKPEYANQGSDTLAEEDAEDEKTPKKTGARHMMPSRRKPAPEPADTGDSRPTFRGYSGRAIKLLGYLLDEDVPRSFFYNMSDGHGQDSERMIFAMALDGLIEERKNGGKTAYSISAKGRTAMELYNRIKSAGYTAEDFLMELYAIRYIEDNGIVGSVNKRSILQGLIRKDLLTAECTLTEKAVSLMGEYGLLMPLATREFEGRYGTQ
ncbi:MAG TPA: hypothetical protein VI979_02230 [archaeon]|nr:hypothetical protein [archaeon]